ncbi:hypothetical protein BH09PSE3_BH09PSE3_22730 [soil metagenome]
MFQSTIRISPTTTPTRWQIPSRCLLIFVLLLSAWSFSLYSGPQPPLAPPPDEVTDGALYTAIAGRIAKGESYYQAAPIEHRLRHFPLRPAVAVRPPLLAEITASVGGPVAIGWLLRLTALATFVALSLRFARDISDAPTRMAAMILAAFSIVILVPMPLAMLHDVWAGMLVALALALRRPGHWGISLAIALTAAVMRELALPLLIVMGFSALIEKRWREAVAWAAAFVTASVLLTMHWVHIATVTNPGDLASEGWLRAMGWPWVVHVFSMTNLLQFLPAAIGAALVPVAILGWATVERGLALRITLWMVGMGCVFMVFGRDQNYYWGALVAPILPIGLAFAPTGISRIFRAAR